ncbi:MAG: transcription antitermination factor NusB [Oscillospiraceae bacterium]|jgi:N utilization substance protein B|nr:transcription antitermination factor NusB [Oscillospiraceae bacterium]
MKQNRRQSREYAFALLFEWSFREDESLDEILEQAKAGREQEPDDFALSLCSRAIENMAELDALIERYSDKWKLNRLSKVVLAALRLAFCELTQFPDIPAGATINEAVELVKTYGAEDESAYVNGILGNYERQRTVDNSADA